MDLANLVSHETTFDLHLRHPVTDDEIGVVFKIRSLSSDAVKAVERKHMDEVTAALTKGKPIKSEVRIRQECERIAACISSWDWGSQNYKGETPELSVSKAADILGEQDWIYSQVREAAANIANFTKA